MNRAPDDPLLGLLVLAASVGGIWVAAGAAGIAYAALCVVVCGLVIRLFESPSRWAKAVAILLLPPLLMRYWQSRKKNGSGSRPPSLD